MLVNYSQEAELSADELQLLERCALAVIGFCNAGQRGIWMNFLDLFDGIFAATRDALVSSVPLPRWAVSLLRRYLQGHPRRPTPTLPHAQQVDVDQPAPVRKCEHADDQ